MLLNVYLACFELWKHRIIKLQNLINEKVFFLQDKVLNKSFIKPWYSINIALYF